MEASRYTRSLGRVFDHWPHRDQRYKKIRPQRGAPLRVTHRHRRGFLSFLYVYFKPRSKRTAARACMTPHREPPLPCRVPAGSARSPAPCELPRPSATIPREQPPPCAPTPRKSIPPQKGNTRCQTRPCQGTCAHPLVQAPRAPCGAAARPHRRLPAPGTPCPIGSATRIPAEAFAFPRAEPVSISPRMFQN